MPGVLRVQGLRYARPEFQLCVDELELRAGEVLAVVGPSGCGKSTLIDLLALLRAPTALQDFALMGEDVGALWRRADVPGCTALRAKHIGVVLQTGGLLPSLSARENIAMAPRLLGRDEPAWIDELLARLELTSLQTRRPAQLSVGQRQRVAMARALSHRPALVLADEPTAALGAEHAHAALALLLSLAREGGAAVLIVSHDLELLNAHRVAMRRFAPGRDGVHLGPPG